jgi:hypothetical protein
MTLDRAELAGTGAAVAFHVALIAALSMSLAIDPAPAKPGAGDRRGDRACPRPAH